MEILDCTLCSLSLRDPTAGEGVVHYKAFVPEASQIRSQEDYLKLVEMWFCFCFGGWFVHFPSWS